MDRLRGHSKRVEGDARGDPLIRSRIYTCLLVAFYASIRG